MGANDKMSVLNNIASTNPQMREVLNYIQKNGGDPKQACYNYAKQFGGDPEAAYRQACSMGQR